MSTPSLDGRDISYRVIALVKPDTFHVIAVHSISAVIHTQDPIVWQTGIHAAQKFVSRSACSLAHSR